MPALLVTDGPFTGWKSWHARPEGRFVDGLGNIYYRDDPAGRGIETAIETGRQHSNGLGSLHGGFIMAYVDVVAFAAIRHMLDTQAAVTLNASTDFLGAGAVGKVLEGRGHIVRETGKLVWVAGTLTQDGGAHLVAQWHALLRKVPRTPR
ncbi:PaaI family thioesterase [Sandaracinobacteroides saxicola]|uniref:PaaI family thioesterase n=1 Tax=Sandaracinobacteroides saxicola TaxID=2759707 RepID=A0A7G5IHE2_9SPHN|nr:PaaI family thioesterase [Sandaracinobacteroides saxicola]QMW22784.1 PaaI family thioesterase [Sandaracinobacteroides saxicola]